MRRNGFLPIVASSISRSSSSTKRRAVGGSVSPAAAPGLLGARTLITQDRVTNGGVMPDGEGLRMKVGLVGTHSATREERSPVDSLAGALAIRGVDVTVYSCRANHFGPDTVETDLGYRVAYTPGRGPSDAELAPAIGHFARFLAKQWALDRPDVVNATTWIYGVAAQLAADHHGIPSVQSLPELSGAVHRPQGRHIGPVTRVRFERLLARSATRVVVSCTDDVLELIKLGCPRTRISVLPQAVDMHQFSPTGPAADRERERWIVAARPPPGIAQVRRRPGMPVVVRTIRPTGRRGDGMAGRTRFTSRYRWERVPAEAHTLYERTAEECIVRPGPRPTHDRVAVSS